MNTATIRGSVETRRFYRDVPSHRDDVTVITEVEHNPHNKRYEARSQLTADGVWVIKMYADNPHRIQVLSQPVARFSKKSFQEFADTAFVLCEAAEQALLDKALDDEFVKKYLLR